EDDRVVPVVERLDVDDRLRPGSRRIVAGELAERALQPALVVPRWHLPGEHDLRRSGDWQPGDLLADHLHRCPTEVADQLVLVPPSDRQAARAAQEEHRILPARYGYRAALAFGPVLARDDVAGMGHGDEDPGCVLVMDHDPVGAEVDLPV